MPDPQRIAATAHAVSLLPLPASQADLAAVGVARGRIRAARDAGELTPVRRGFWVPTSVWLAATAADRHELELRAALRAFPGAWASRSSAARRLGLPTFDEPSPVGDQPHVHLSRAGTTWREPGLTVHGNEVPEAFIEPIGRLLSTNLVRTAIETAAVPSPRRALAVIDAAMRLHVGKDAPDVRWAVRDPSCRDRACALFDAAVAPFSRHRWVTTVREAIQLADPAAESVLESMSRWSIMAAELPAPQCGVPLLGDDGVVYWVDLLWEDRRLIGEADGRAKYTSVDDLVAEKRRQEALSGAGYQIVRWGWDEGVTRPEIMIERLRRALRS